MIIFLLSRSPKSEKHLLRDLQQLSEEFLSRNQDKLEDRNLHQDFQIHHQVGMSQENKLEIPRHNYLPIKEAQVQILIQGRLLITFHKLISNYHISYIATVEMVLVDVEKPLKPLL